MRLALTLTLLLLGVCAAHAQTPQPSPTPEATTKIEKFQARVGAVIIKGFSDIGSIGGTGGVVEVTSMEFTDAQSGVKVQGVVIQLKEIGRLSREARSFIDYDEIDSLLKGINYIAKVELAVTKLDNFEAIYRTKSEFSVTTFSNNSQVNGVAISSGRYSPVRVFLKQDDLTKFRELLLMAQGKLDSAK